MAGSRLLIPLCFVATAVWGQTNRYVIFLKDKVGTPYSISQPQAFLSQRSLARRAHNAVQTTADDLPVSPSYVSLVTIAGAKVFFTSRWMNLLLVEATQPVISAVSSLAFVARTEMVAPGKKLIGGRTKKLKFREAMAADNVTQSQLQMLGIDQMQAAGFTGSGIMISVFDSGFPGVNVNIPFRPIFDEGRMKMTGDLVTNSGNVYQFDKHGSEVFSQIAARQEGGYTGGAYKADYLLFVTEDVSSEYRIEEYNWLFAAEKADSAGTDIIQASLGYNLFDDSSMDYTSADLNGKTAVISRAAAMARDKGMVVVVSAGNEGANSWHYVTPPADVSGILAVGAVNSMGEKVNFSSIGPTADGRTKPDVMALGQGNSVVLPDGSVGLSSGTSMAAPLVSSLVAGLMQAYPQLTASEIVEALKSSASKGNSPNNQLGFGIPNYIAFKNLQESSKGAGDVALYPNPSRSSFKLAFKELPDGPVRLTFYDAQGKLLQDPSVELTWFTNPMEVSIAGLGAGMYFVKVSTSGLERTFRFVKL